MTTNSQTPSERFSSASQAGAQATEYLKNAGDALRNAGNFEVSVTGGVHSGAHLTFEAGTVTIGSGRENDMVLFGAGVANKHLEIQFPKGLLNPIQINPIEDAVFLADGSIVEVGQYAQIEADSSLRFGDSEIYISRIADPKKFVKPGLRLMAMACMIMMLPIGYGLLSNLAVGFADASSHAISSITSTVENTSRKYLGTTAGFATGTNPDVADAFTWSVRAQLEDLKLNHRLRASTTADGSIRVYGNVSNSELPRWTAFLKWYDSKTNFPSLIRDVQRMDVERDLPAIKSVWMDDKPSVFFKDGTVGTLGATIKNGWKIVGINNSNVVIERDGATISLTY